jgi:hypothetical protein
MEGKEDKLRDRKYFDKERRCGDPGLEAGLASVDMTF